MTSANMSDKQCVVLVTGGAGCLGQHVVGLLQTRAEHVTEIRVLDVVPYENKLDYVHSKPLRSIVGSITDGELMKDVLDGVHSVIHIAGTADSSMFPNADRIRQINVQGTLVTVESALRTSSVQRLINCSSTSVGIGYDSDVTNGIRETDPVPQKFVFEPYAPSKLTGERMALHANSSSFRTLSIRPLVMYGELDIVFITQSQIMASTHGGTLYRVDTKGVPQQQAYVGNVAWGFVCAEIKLYKEQCVGACASTVMSSTQALGDHDVKDVDKLCTELRQIAREYDVKFGLTQIQDTDGNPDTCNEGQRFSTQGAYYIVDDTPVGPPFEFQEPYLTCSGYKLSSFKLPGSLMIALFFCLYWMMRLLRLFDKTMNYPVSVHAMHFLRRPYVFSAEKAKAELGYSPIFSPEEAQARSMPYYQNNPNIQKIGKKKQ